MSYIADEARQDLLREIAEAIDRLGVGLARLGSAYELVDERTADVLESELFGPLQVAFGRAKRTYTGFAGRHGLTTRTFAAGSAGAASATARDQLEATIEAVEDADAILSELQDSMRPVEVGDPELRAGLAEVRRLLDPLPARARRMQGLLGR